MKIKGLGQGKSAARQMYPEEISRLQYQMNDLRVMVYELEMKLTNLVRYSEYLADNVSSLTNYADFLSTRISRGRQTNASSLSLSVDDRIPSFNEFDEMKRSEAESSND